MLRVLSEEEAIEYEKTKTEKILSWFNNLSFKEKEMIYDQYENIFHQMKCSHDFFLIPNYGKRIRQCRHCEYNELDEP